MSNLNLDITTYKLEELENLLKLKANYKQEEIFEAKTKMEKFILKSNLNESKREELYIFLDNIYNKLTNNLLKIDKSKFNDVTQYDGNHFVIKNENNQYSSVLENNKKINKSIIKRTYTIDSLFRSNYDNPDNQSHDFIITLPEIVTKAITMSISSIQIPLTYHNISEELNNNVFRIEVLDSSDNPTDISGNIELTSGLYEARNVSALTTNILGATFTSQIKAADIEFEIKNRIIASDIPDICNNLTFFIDSRSGYGTFEYNDNGTTGLLTNGNKIKIKFDVDNEKTFNGCGDDTFKYKFNEIYQRLGWQLGFRPNEIIIDNSNSIFIETLTDASNIARVASRGIAYINYPRYLYIAIDDFQASSRNYFSIASESIIAPNIIARINILSLLEDKTAFKMAAAPGDFNYSQKHIREYFGPTDINKLKIQLLDEYGRTFPINNMDWSFILSFECFYN